MKTEFFTAVGHTIRQAVQFTSPTRCSSHRPLRHVQILQRTKCLVVVDDPINHKSDIHLYDLARGMGEPKKSLHHLRVGTDFRIAVDETSRLLALYSNAEVPTHSRLRRHNAYFGQVSLIIFQFDEQFTQLQQRGADVSLRNWYSALPTITHFIFVPGGEELCLIKASGNARIFSLITEHPRCGTSILVTPNYSDAPL